MPLQATSGAASYDAFGGGVAAAPQYIEDVFSTWLYTGTSASQTITNGIDLAGKGGLVWVKTRAGDSNQSHVLVDSNRGWDVCLQSPRTEAQASISPSGLTPLSNGFSAVGNSLSTFGMVNYSGRTFTSWTFRKQPKFFDVVTYTGNGISGTAIPHNLGSVPGCIIIKRTDIAGDWFVYHRSYNGGVNPQQYTTYLNQTAAVAGPGSFSQFQAPTATAFYPGSSVNTLPASGITPTYVAYIFAHNAGGFGLTGTDNVISCGSYTGTGATQSISLGYEPQWLMIKRTDTTNNWQIVDVMRGWVNSSVVTDDNPLYANSTNAEGSAVANGFPNATGFTLDTAAAPVNASGGTYIYIAIRRGPMKTPTSGTSVFAPLVRTGTASSTTVTGFGFPLDLVASLFRSSSQDVWFDRLRGPLRQLATTTTAAETTQSASINGFDLMDGYRVGIDNVTNMTNGNTTTSGYLNYGFRRAPSVFDVVCYTGTGANRTVAHNLAAVPELMIVKCRTTAGTRWPVYYGDNTSYMYLDLTQFPGGLGPNSGFWNNTSPTSSVFTVGTTSVVNNAGDTYVAYLFATCPGVSKVFNYTGNGSSQTINCGFTGGARFVMIKRTDNTGDWYVWDSARGIVSGNDPRLSLNTTAAEVTTDDSVDTDSTGFIVNQVAATNVNVNAATYIGIAIA